MADAEDIQPLVCDNGTRMVGQKVYAIGNPFGLDHTLTNSVISGLGREINSAATDRPIQDVIQTDAAINLGNSGGPLLDSSGFLIGINIAIYSPSGASAGVGFSIPVDTVNIIVDQLVKYGKITRPVLGIMFAPDQSVERLGVTGVLVLDASPDGPAGKAGLRPTKRDAYGRLILRDIITTIGQNLRQMNVSYCPISDVGLLALASLRCLQNIKVVYLRNVMVNGFVTALRACESLKKLKLLQSLKFILPQVLIHDLENRGCNIRWIDN